MGMVPVGADVHSSMEVPASPMEAVDGMAGLEAHFRAMLGSVAQKAVVR